MLLKLAWRNIWRNKRRTLITLLSLIMGVTGIIFLHSFRESANGEMVRSITRGLVGHLQVHAKGYQDAPDIANVVPDPVTLQATLAGSLPGVNVEQRVIGAGLAAGDELSAAVVVMGVEPGSEGIGALMTVEQGRALAAIPAREAVLGKGLAHELGVEPGGEMVLVGQGADGSLANDRFTVVGIADAGSNDANASTVFLHLGDAQSFFALGAGVHQVIVRLPDEEEDDLTAPVALLRGALDLNTLEVLAWTEMLPELKKTMDAKGKQQHVVDFIVFLIVALGVLNTMTMSTFERTREFGVMASLGTRRGRILGMVVLEALFQGIIGFTVGLAIAAALLHGIGSFSFAAMGEADMMGIRMPDTIVLRVHTVAAVSAGITAFFTMLLGGLFPAFRASRLKPVEATRYV